MKNSRWIEFVTCTLVPFLIPMVSDIIPKEHISELAVTIISGIILAIDAFFIVRFYVRTNKDKQEQLATKINSTAYTNAFQLSERKRDYIVKKTYDEDYILPKKVIPYNVHDYIAEICRSFRDTVSQITSISQEQLSVTFVYHYDHTRATDCDRSWRWVIGKEFTNRTELDTFVKRENSLYNHLINGREDGSRINSLFCNDKKDLAYAGHYYMSARDKVHNKIGSVFAVKVIFGNNADAFVEGILLVSSYGKRFVESDSEYTEKQLKKLLFEELYPYYQRLLETELGILYLRHDDVERCEI